MRDSFDAVADLYRSEAADAAKSLGVRVLLRHVTLTEIDQVPVVITYDPKLADREESTIADYLRRCDVVVPAPNSAALTRACARAMEQSPADRATRYRCPTTR